MRITVLLPTLNEREGIEKTIRSIPKERLEKAGHQVDVVIVDGVSRDGTAEAAARLGAHVIVESRRGYGRAYKTGFASAPGDVVVTADADGTYPLGELETYLDEFIEERLDFATLNRFAHLEPGAMGLKHRFGNRVLTLTSRLLYGVGIRDSQSGMWLLSRRALDALPFDALSDGMAFSQELKLAAFRDRGMRSREFAGHYAPRIGEAKLGSWRDGLRNLGLLVARRFQRSPRGKGSG